MIGSPNTLALSWLKVRYLIATGTSKHDRDNELQAPTFKLDKYTFIVSSSGR